MHFSKVKLPHFKRLNFVIFQCFALNETSYLSCFYSIGQVNRKYVYTYTMGAYIFDAKAPFKMMAMISEPIVHESFLNDSSFALAAFDIKTIPTNAWIQGNEIYVSYSLNYKTSSVMVLQLHELIKLMTEVRSIVIGDSIWNDEKPELK